MTKLALSIWLCFGASALVQSAELGVSIAYAEIASPPYFLGNGNTIPPRPGAAVTLMAEALTACRLKPTWSRLPSKRLFAMLQADQIDISFMYSFNEERTSLFVYPSLGGQPDHRFRIASLVYSLYVPRHSTLQWDGKQLQGLNGNIGANTGWSIVEDLRKRSLPVEESAGTALNFRKLQAGRLAAYATQDNIGDQYLTAQGIVDIVKLQPPLSRKDYFAVVSRGWFQQHPTEAKCLWQQVARLREQRLPTLLKQESE